MKSKVKENIGYIAIAIVVALTLVLSVVVIDTYQNKDIVANAQFDANGESYSDIPIGTYKHLHTQIESAYHQDGFINVELDYEFVPQNKSLYFISFNFTNEYEESLTYYSYFYPIDDYAELYMNNSSGVLPCIGGSSFVPSSFTELQDYPVYSYYIVYDSGNETFWISINDNIGTFGDTDELTVDIYLVANSVQSNFLSAIGDGITFGFQSIAHGVSYTMDNLFIVDGELTNFSTVLFLTLGIGLALAIVKFVLRFIFSLGGKF